MMGPCRESCKKWKIFKTILRVKCLIRQIKQSNSSKTIWFPMKVSFSRFRAVHNNEEKNVKRPKSKIFFNKLLKAEEWFVFFESSCLL